MDGCNRASGGIRPYRQLSAQPRTIAQLTACTLDGALSNRCADCGSADFNRRLDYGELACDCILGPTVAIWIPVIGWVASPFLLIGAASFIAATPFSRRGRQAVGNDCGEELLLITRPEPKRWRHAPA